MKTPKRGPDPVSGVAELARQLAEAPTPVEVHVEGRRRVVAAALSRARGGGLPLRKALLGAVAIAGTVAAWFLRPRPLAYEVVGGSASSGSYVSAPSSGPVDLKFSDGSEVRAEAGGRLRVGETYTHGARVLLENGTVLSHIVHHRASRWTFVAGPFEIDVIGTRFDCSWDPRSEELDVTLREGSVEVASPLADRPIVVRAGQHFRAAVPLRTLSVTDLEAAPPPPRGEAQPSDRTGALALDLSQAAPGPAAAAPPGAVLPESSPQGPSAQAPGAGAKPSSKRPSWQELLARGGFEAIVSQATAKGLDACVTGCAANDLRSLADAARYTNRAELASRCLLALRRRFPGGSQSGAAAFLLGRSLEVEAPDAADRWYETYLREAPDGEFAAEALAGRMRAIAGRRGAKAASGWALEYLRRYPQGVHVNAARKIAGLD